MMTRKIWFLGLVFLPLLIGCAAKTFNARITRPAEVNLKGYSKIAIGEITGKGGTEVSEDLTQALFESGRFEVLDRQHLARIMQEHKLGVSDVVDASTAAQLGKFIGTAALVFGRVSVYKYDEELSHDDWMSKEGKSHRDYTRKGTASVTANLQVVDVETGRILAIKKLDSEYYSTKNTRDKLPESIDPDPLFASARRSIARKFMKMIAPYQEMVKVTLLKSKEVPSLEKGIAFAKRGDWEEALKVFEEASKSNPDDSKVWFDLGVAYEFVGEFRQAELALKKACDIEPKGKYMDELDRCKKRAAEQQKLKEQEAPTP